MDKAVCRAFVGFAIGNQRSTPRRNAAVARTCAAAMAAEAPGAIAASGGGAVGDFVRTRASGGVDRLAVVIAIGLMVIEVGFVRGGIGVGVRGEGGKREEGGEEDWGGVEKETFRHFFCFCFVLARGV